MRKFVFVALAAIAYAPAALAGGLMVSDAWMRSLPNGLPAAGYFVLHNDTAKAVSLTGASSPACGMIMLHKSEMVGGMMQMSHMDKVDAPAGSTATFAPGGNHLMCMEPKPALKPGATVAVTLSFADGSSLTANFPVKNASGK